MGLLALAAYVFPFLIGSVVLSGAIVSAYRNLAMGLYWVVGGVSLVPAFMVAYPAPRSRSYGGDYGGLQRLLDNSFNLFNGCVLVGGLIVLVLACAGRQTVDRALSGAAWGFALAFFLRQGLLLAN